MPTMGGLDVVRNLKHGSYMPVIVVVTAYDKFAIQAFEAGASRLSTQTRRTGTSRPGGGTGKTAQRPADI